MPPGINTVDTSLSLVGKNYPNYGVKIAENFLHLLENFAAATPPLNPIIGQLWYDTSDITNKRLRINDGTGLGSNSPTIGIVHQQPTAPTNVKIGDIWVDTNFQQLKIYNGDSWTLIGPSFSTTLQTGGYPDVVAGTDGADHYIIKNYLNGDVVTIVAKEIFKPIAVIEGFDNLVAGVNLSNKDFGSTAKFNGLAVEAAALRVTIPVSQAISANSFVRNDISQSLAAPLTINNDSGLRIGTGSSTFLMQKSGNDAIITNIQDSGKINFKIEKSGMRNSILTIDGGTRFVGINQYSPTASLDVVGTIQLSSTATLLGNVIVGANLSVAGDTAITGSVVAASFSGVGSAITGILGTSVNGTVANATYSASAGATLSLINPQQFSMTGQIAATTSTSFNGTHPVLFNTVITPSAITAQQSTSTVTASYLLPVTDGTTLYKSTKSDFLADVIPALIKPGMILAWASISGLPTGWLLCNGASYNLTGSYSSLFAVIGTTYGNSGGPGTFQVPTIAGLVATGAPTINYIIKF